MGDSFTLPLRPVQEKQDHLDTLPIEIAQINNEWGSFRDVNEEVLRAKIAEEERNGASKTEDNAVEIDSTERLEQLYKRRADILQFAMFVSHLDTKNIPLTLLGNRTWKPCLLSISFPSCYRNTLHASPRPP